MRTCDVLIVGGGPAGSTAAWQLRKAGADVLVLDRERFPRLKLCAGWITPEVVRELGMDLAAYPHRLLTFPRLRVHVGRLHLPVACVQHSIRRFEFDAWLLERSGAPVEQHTVRHIVAEAGGYVIDGAYRCRYLIGAGGTRCPVYRELFRELNPRDSELQIVTLEHEIAYDWQDSDCHLWFFDAGLPGYSWYVPKERGWLNVGIGGIAARMKRGGHDIRAHWARLAAMLDGRLARGARYEPTGYSYYLRGGVGVVRRDNAFITGDAAGLATRDLGEGIGPAVRSGLRAAASILKGTTYQIDDVTGLSVSSIARSMLGRLSHAGIYAARRVPAAAPGGGPAHGLRHRDQ
ncbi:MAG TPA: NAD(P)/FAD-dependent oxidoreductase [Steroidobacteraceae bacterium]|jgi:flavin-dependent dehydrogenase|nr:NAD(P)/FAD-dependent oxidoreductase [Steroidobacteraceae bacterium]